MATDEEFDVSSILTEGIAAHAYVAFSAVDGEHEHAVLVYASNEEMARELGARDMSGDVECTEVRRAPEHDARAITQLHARVEDDPEYMRNAGWHLEGELQCGCCGLSAYGQEKYGVCRVSNLCKECGCDDANDGDELAGPCQHEEGFSCE